MQIVIEVVSGLHERTEGLIRSAAQGSIGPCPTSAPTLTTPEQETLLGAYAAYPRDHPIFLMAVGTGLRLAEIVGLEVGDVYFPNGSPRGRFLLRREIAKDRRAGDVFLPDALIPKLQRCLQLPDPSVRESRI